RLPCVPVVPPQFPRSVFAFYGDHRHPPSFPTRRSSDLSKCRMPMTRLPASRQTAKASGRRRSRLSPWPRRALNSSVLFRSCSSRSEEHTSELQSRENLVCRLLLEKKKKQTRRDDAGRSD